MTWVMENKNSAPGNRVAVINLKVQILKSETIVANGNCWIMTYVKLELWFI